MGFEVLLGLVVFATLVHLLIRARNKSRLAYIDNYTFHPAIRKKLSQKYPQLNETEIRLVFDGLREYFYICKQAKKRMVAMPSQAVDVAWHEFILFTKAYEIFCRKALG